MKLIKKFIEYDKRGPERMNGMKKDNYTCYLFTWIMLLTPIAILFFSALYYWNPMPPLGYFNFHEIAPPLALATLIMIYGGILMLYAERQYENKRRKP